MYDQFESAIQYTFRDKSLLRQAFTHSSFSNENEDQKNNERLEFLGDAVLELMVSAFLFHKHPDMAEGDLTKTRARLVCEPSLAQISRNLKIGRYLNLGKGEMQTGGASRDSILSDAFEAIIGAVYLDGGVDCANKVIEKCFSDLLEKQSLFLIDKDYKTALQEMIQKDSSSPISYRIIRESGPDHNKLFTAQVTHNSDMLGTGKGRSKKEAEQNAAYSAILKLRP